MSRYHPSLNTKCRGVDHVSSHHISKSVPENACRYILHTLSEIPVQNLEGSWSQMVLTYSFSIDGHGDGRREIFPPSNRILLQQNLSLSVKGNTCVQQSLIPRFIGFPDFNSRLFLVSFREKVFRNGHSCTCRRFKLIQRLW